MQRGGWYPYQLLKAINRHSLDYQTKEVHDKANAHFTELYDTKYDTKKKRPCNNRAFRLPATGIERFPNAAKTHRKEVFSRST